MTDYYKDLTDIVHKKYNVNLTLCKIIGQRWSFIYEPGDNFVHGRNRVIIDGNYGFIIDCDDNTADEIKKYTFQA